MPTVPITTAPAGLLPLIAAVHALPVWSQAPLGTIVGVTALAAHHKGWVRTSTPQLLIANNRPVLDTVFLSTMLDMVIPTSVFRAYTLMVEQEWAFDAEALPFAWHASDPSKPEDVRTLIAMHGGVALVNDIPLWGPHDGPKAAATSVVFEDQARSAHARVRARQEANHIQTYLSGHIAAIVEQDVPF